MEDVMLPGLTFSIMDCSLALIALINPISKIFIVSTLAPGISPLDMKRVIVRSSAVALIILLSFLFLGNFILTRFFHIQIYAFKIAGGLVLASRGFEALNKGLFFEVKYRQKLEDISIVPIASPMIAGPATITAAVSFPSKYGLPVTAVSVVIAVAVNMLVMILTPLISEALSRHNVMGALIRITGLIVATIGVQMALDGFGEYLRAAGII